MENYFLVSLPHWVVIAGAVSLLFLLPIIYEAFGGSIGKIISLIIKSNNESIQATECGHETKVVDKVEKYGEKIETKVPIKDGKTAFCHKCLEEMAIRCAWCGRPIFIGNPVTLYVPFDKNKQMPDYAVLYNEEHKAYVGCFRLFCAESRRDKEGYWYPPGKVHRIPSPIDVAIQELEKRRSNVIVVK